MSPIKVLIVDDSALIRHTFKVLLESEADIKVIDTAGDPYVAVHKIQREKPDVITLDIEMPRMDGLTFLKKIMDQAPMPVVVITNQTMKGANVALKALEIGAVEVLTKPKLSSEREIEESRILLVDKVRSAYYARQSTKFRPKINRDIQKPRVSQDSNGLVSNYAKPKIIAVGASTGGTQAIKTFLQDLPATMPPILIVQHMPEKFTSSFAKRLNEVCALTVKEADEYEKVEENTVYIARGNQHLIIKKNHQKVFLQTYQGELVNRHRPSVNVLFDSVAETAGKNAIGIILTGMGDDGASGLLKMYQKGAFTIAQDQDSSIVFGMPHKAIQAGAVCKVLPLEDIAKNVCDLVCPGKSGEKAPNEVSGS